jgi:hypothetical protein
MEKIVDNLVKRRHRSKRKEIATMDNVQVDVDRSEKPRAEKAERSSVKVKAKIKRSHRKTKLNVAALPILNIEGWPKGLSFNRRELYGDD